MSAISDFQKFDASFKQAKEWAALIGSPYSGGGGGVGKVANTSGAKIELYHQAYDGATNYHEAPNEDVRIELHAALIVNANMIIKEALERMAKRHRALADAAKLEAESIIAAAELANAGGK